MCLSNSESDHFITSTGRGQITQIQAFLVSQQITATHAKFLEKITRFNPTKFGLKSQPDPTAASTSIL